MAIESPLQHFAPSEFDSPDAPGTGAPEMNDELVRGLDEARAHAGIPFRVTSGYRTPEHNEEVGGVPNSAHVRGYAADISLEGLSPAEVLVVVTSLYRAGFRRIGWSVDSFVHVDNDPDKPSPAIWDYSDAEHKA